MTENAVARSEALEVFDPRSGEIVDLRKQSDEDLAAFLQWIRDQEEGARRSKKLISIELHRRMDGDALWTREAETFRIKGAAPPTPDYEAERLRPILEQLVKDGDITEAAMENACPLETKPKAKKQGIKALAKLGKKIADAIKQAEKPVDLDSRSVSLEELPKVRSSSEILEGESEELGPDVDEDDFRVDD